MREDPPGDGLSRDGLTLLQAAARLEMSPGSLRLRIRAGDVPARDDGGTTLLRAVDVEVFALEEGRRREALALIGLSTDEA